MLRLGVIPDAARAEGLERRLLELFHSAPPLKGDQRLDTARTALTHRNGVPVRLTLLEQSTLLAPREDASAGLLLRHARDVGNDVVHAPVAADHHRLGEAVATSDLEVHRIVARGDLERTRAELGLHALVGDDRDPSLDEGHDRLLADEVAVALVVRVNGNRDVRENRRRAARSRS